MKNHWLRMIIGCGLPLLVIFLAPSFGIGDGLSLFIFIIFMFACHLFMPHGSHGHVGHNHTGKQNNIEHYKESTPVETKKDHKGHHQN